ncbi:MAG TPA: hypothetical protein VGD63_12745 [Steroidobacteraceae bacterium]
MHALVVVVVTVGVIVLSLVGLLSVWTDLHARIDFPDLAPPDYEEEPYGDSPTIPGLADESLRPRA